MTDASGGRARPGQTCAVARQVATRMAPHGSRSDKPMPGWRDLQGPVLFAGLQAVLKLEGVGDLHCKVC